ncbi:type II glyceraldehyde-3-phosphate dehydrogenase [Halorientalis salina]|uniref:type II glyceraldehyde-3-phosphate dehydrogenase n=1 Tax=Halorientalis salina TaxID=2932266 RepID=UPI0010ABF5E2|nr:type II glyceraldehyde-3-phosphate dehydrogenase [Halorientalis salina]
MIQVGINGYGTIGKRVADAVRAQPDMEVVGVAKTRPNFESEQAVTKGFPLYAAVEERIDQFAEAGIDLAGEVEELVAESDVVVDTTPSGIGAENKSMYEEYDTPALYQGGEDADLVDVSFNARSNYEEAADADHVRVVSCNTTGLSRLVAPLDEEYGVEKVRATLVRRGGDPAQSGRGPINDTLPDPITVPSHHGPDVNTIFPDLDIDTVGMKVPATLTHTHSINIELGSDADTESVRELLENESRLFVIPERLGIDGSGKLKEFALDAGRPRGDVWENAIWGESITVQDGELYLFQAIHQESDVVPENVDAIRAVTGSADRDESMATTEAALDLGFDL